MFNPQLKELLEKYLNAKSVVPMIPGAAQTHAVAGTILDKIRGAVPEPGPEAPDLSHPELPPLTREDLLGTPPAAPAPQAPVAARPPVAPAAPTAPQAPSPMNALAPKPATPDVQNVYGSQYDDNARKALYDDLAAKRQQGAGWEAIGSIADMNSRIGGSNGIGSQDRIAGKVESADKLAKSEFEAGRKGRLEDQAANISLRKAGREETEYKDANDANSQMSRLAVGMAGQMLGPQKMKQMGWEPGKSTYADVVKLLPIIEKQVALETAKSNKSLALSTRDDQFKDSKIQSFRKEIMGGKPYQALLTVSGMAKSVRMAAKDPSAYGDLSSIYALVKGLDPTSVVREGEIGLMREVSGLKDRLLGTLEKWGGRGPLTGTQMQDIEKVMGRLEQIAADNVRNHAAPTLNQAKRMSLAENEIIGDLPSAQAPTAPSVTKPASAGWKVIR